MAPSAVDTAPVEAPRVSKAAFTEKIEHREPLKTTGVLDAYEWFDTTPVIGREFPKASLVEWLQAPNADELLRDLAITSTSPSPYASFHHNNRNKADLTRQSRSAASSFSAPRTTSTITSKRSSSCALAS